MSTYVTQADMVTAFGTKEMTLLTDRAMPPLDTIDVAVLAAQLARANDIISAHVERRYLSPLLNVPPVPVPVMLVGVGCDLVRYWLYDFRATEQVTLRFEQAMALLRGIAIGSTDVVGLALLSASAAGAFAWSTPIPRYDVTGLI